MKNILTDIFGFGRYFALLWLGKTVSRLGGGLLNFAFGIWVYQMTGSAKQFGTVFLSIMLPALIVLPFAGTLADHFDRRWVIIFSNIAAALVAIALTVLLSFDALIVSYLYLFSALNTASASVRTPAYTAAARAALPEDGIVRANSLMVLSDTLIGLGVPALAGFLMAKVNLVGIAFIQLASMTAGALAVFTAFIYAKDKMHRPTKSERPRAFRSFVGGLSPAVDFLRRRQPLLLTLLVYQVLHDGLLSLASIMMMPLILSTHTSTTIGIVSSSGAIGAVFGSALLAAADVKKRLMLWLIGSNICLSTCVAVIGASTSTVLWCLCAFVALLSASMGGACSQALWMRKTPNAIQGSIFSFLQVSALVVVSIVVFSGGIVGERVLEPAFAVGGLFADNIGQWIGTGKGRGLGFLFILSGFFGTIITVAFLTGSRIRELDESVEDVRESNASTVEIRTVAEI